MTHLSSLGGHDRLFYYFLFRAILIGSPHKSKYHILKKSLKALYSQKANIQIFFEGFLTFAIYKGFDNFF